MDLSPYYGRCHTLALDGLPGRATFHEIMALVGGRHRRCAGSRSASARSHLSPPPHDSGELQMVLLEFAMAPRGHEQSLSADVARIVDIIDRSGLPYQLSPANVDEAVLQPDIGPRLGLKIREIVVTGRVRRLEAVQTDGRAVTLALFGQVWGIAPPTAKPLSPQGYPRLDQLTAAGLTHQQLIGFSLQAYRFVLNCQAPLDVPVLLGLHLETSR